jgi:multidrug efflux system membrane fusion protein
MMLAPALPRFRRLALISCFTSLAIALAGCGAQGSSGGGAKGRKGGGAAPVVVGKVTRKVVPLEIEAIGLVEAIRTAGVRSQVTGVVQKIAIQEGQDVNAGDLLFEIDPRPFRNALKSAEADSQKLHVQLEYARGQVARYKTLSSDSMVSKEQYQKIQDDARALEAQALVAESSVANAKLQLEYSSIRAPLSGRTGNLNLHEGDLIRANEAGAALVTVNQLSPIYVTFGLPQQHLGELNRYRASARLAVRATPPGLDPTPEVGELTFVDNTVDPATGTIKLKATFPNTAHRLWPGQFSTVNITLIAPEVLAVPASAVQTSQTGQHVYVVREDKSAERREVVIERTLRGDAVVTKGLKEGEVVVTEGQLRVMPGGALEIRPGPGEAAPAGEGKAKAKKVKEKEKSADKEKKK